MPDVRRGLRWPRDRNHRGAGVRRACRQAEEEFRRPWRRAMRLLHAGLCDASASREMPGVHAVITAADVVQRPIGVAKDHLPLKSGLVRSMRDEIAAVAAETEEIANSALGLIKVDYQPLPIVASAEDAMKPGALLPHGKNLRGPGPDRKPLAPHKALPP